MTFSASKIIHTTPFAELPFFCLRVHSSHFFVDAIGQLILQVQMPLQDEEGPQLHPRRKPGLHWGSEMFGSLGKCQRTFASLVSPSLFLCVASSSSSEARESDLWGATFPCSIRCVSFRKQIRPRKHHDAVARNRWKQRVCVQKLSIVFDSWYSRMLCLSSLPGMLPVSTCTMSKLLSFLFFFQSVCFNASPWHIVPLFWAFETHRWSLNWLNGNEKHPTVFPNESVDTFLWPFPVSAGMPPTQKLNLCWLKDSFEENLFASQTYAHQNLGKWDG